MYYHPFIVITIITIKCNSAVITLCYSGTDTSVGVKNIDLRARQGRKCQILTLEFLYLGPKVFFCLFLSTAHITTTTSGATTFPYFPKLKYDASCVDLGPKLRVVALLYRYSPKMAKILVEP